MNATFSSSFASRRSIVGVLYLVAAASVFAMWVWSADTRTTAINSDPRSTLSDLIYGTAHKPYVQRALVPLLTRAAYAMLPESLWHSLMQPLQRLPKTQKEMRRLGWEEDYFPEYVIAFAMAFIIFLPFPFIARRMWQLLYPSDDRIAPWAGIAPLVIVPTFFATGPHYIYDLPALTLFTAGAVLLVQGRWSWYYPLFVAGCINKETMVLLVVAFILLYRTSLTLSTVLKHVALHLVLFGAVKLMIMHAFADNPGPVLAFQLFANVHRLLMGYSWTELLVATATVLLIVYRLDTKPRTLVQLSLLVVPFGVLMVLFGVLSELRAVYELIPILTFMMLHTVCFDILKLSSATNRSS
jgi:hypothetical protein